MRRRFLIKLTIFFSFFLIAGCIHKERLYKKTFISLGTFIEVSSPYKKALPLVFSTFRRLERIFNIYDENSQISQVNQQAGVEPVKVDRELVEAVKLAKDLCKITGGAFDPSIGKAILFWKEKIKNKDQQEVSESKVDYLKTFKGIKYIKIDEAKQTIFIDKKGLILDLGGMVKGYIVDKAVQVLKKNNIDSALINAGGDIYCLGKRFGKFWRIGIRNPKALSSIIETLNIEDMAIATSGDYEQFFQYKGEKFSHIIDPETLYPVKSKIRSVTVIAPNTTTADGLATAFFVMGKDGVLKFLERNPSNIKIFLIEEEEGKLHIHCFGDF
ncbi:MAG: FAD:protein FMN transferase [Candidatus Omnitrophica bacterium]|nr:FAD:protein FMN transferase [Candidatus Omnitrophota bacterium]